MVVQLRQSQYLRQKGYQLDEQLAGKRLQELDNHSPLRAARRRPYKKHDEKAKPWSRGDGKLWQRQQSQPRRSRRKCRQAASSDGILIISGKFRRVTRFDGNHRSVHPPALAGNGKRKRRQTRGGFYSAKTENAQKMKQTRITIREANCRE